MLNFEHLEAIEGPTLRREHDADGNRAFTSRLIELDHDATTATTTTATTTTGPTSGAAELPPTFGAGSVISERTYRVPTEAQGEFHHASEEVIWPWLEQAGGRLIASGQDPFSTSDELVTLFAFRSLAEWQRLSRPAAALKPPGEVVGAWVSRAAVIDPHVGRRPPTTTHSARLAPRRLPALPAATPHRRPTPCRPEPVRRPRRPPTPPRPLVASPRPRPRCRGTGRDSRATNP